MNGMFKRRKKPAMRNRQIGSVSVLRKLRNAAYAGLWPLDRVFRKVNRLGNYPPIHLRRHASCLGSFDGHGMEFVAYLKLLAGLKDGGHLWDIGCGCGLLELALESCGWSGRVTGNDIHLPSIQWASRHITPRIPSNAFVHSDIFNEAYWPAGRLEAAKWFDTFDVSGFSAVIAKSLFTHMFPDEMGIYLAQVSQRLVPGGRGILTFFLLNERSLTAPFPRISFQKNNADDVFAVRNRHAPTAAVAYDESALMERIRAAGMAIHDIHPGAWTGQANGLSFQDLVIVGR
jgi:hypothetical protein